MPSIRKSLRFAAVLAVVTSGTVVVAATPSSAIDAVSLNTAVIRDVVYIDPLPGVGEIIDVGDLPSCNPEAGTSYCITVGSVVLGPLAIPNVDTNTVHLTDVVAYLDRYDASVGNVGTDLLTCISLAQPTGADPCALLGFELVEHTPLVAQAVDAYTPFVADEPLTTVTACEGQLVAKTVDREVRAPVITVC